MNSSMHYQLLTGHTFFKKVFLRRIQKFYPDLLPGQPKVIEFLLDHHQAFQREIADGCLIEPPTLSLILDKMERKGLISRKKDSSNRKNILIELTPAGILAGEKCKAVFAETEDDFCKTLTAGERLFFQQILTEICKNGKELYDCNSTK